MLYSQGIGPLNRSSTRRAVGFVLRFVDTITVRDSISKDELVSLGIEDVEVTADAVLAMQPADLSIGSHILKGYISKISEADEQRKRIGVAVRSWKEDTESVSYTHLDVYKRQVVRPMDVEEAILQMNLIGHDFFMFFNAETEAMNVVYRRHDGFYGLIEPELQ